MIGSFFLLLTVGSTLVAFRGVPGAASNGDLSSIELRQQREAAAAQASAGLITASNVLGDSAQGSRERGATGDVFGQLASAGRGNPAGNIRQGAGGNSGPGLLRPGTPGTPLGEKAPTTNAPTTSPGSGTGVIETPVDPGVLADDGSSSTDDSGSSGSGTDSGSSTDSGSDSGSSGSGSTGGSTGTGSGDAGSGTDSGSGSSGGSTGTVTDPVEDTTGSVGSGVGTVSPAAGTTVTDTGSAVGGLLDNATSVVEGLTGGLAG